jgi:hypothetical protein
MKRETKTEADPSKSDSFRQAVTGNNEKHDHRYREWMHRKVVKALRRREVVLKPLC